MNILPRDKQIEIIAALCDGLGIRAAARITGTNRGTVASLALRIGQGCAELHDRMMVGIRANRIELDELWAFVKRKRRQHEIPSAHPETVGDQYTYVAMSASTRAIISYRTGKRTAYNTEQFIEDLRERVIGSPELSSDGFQAYTPAIREVFGTGTDYGQIIKTYSVTHLNVNEASRRYSPAEVIEVERKAVSGAPSHISTSYVERSHLTLRQTCKRFARLGNGFSKKLEPHCAAVSLYVSFYNLCRVHESLRSTPAMAMGLTDRVWSIGDLLDAALAPAPGAPENAPDQRGRFCVIEGGEPRN